MHHTFKDGIGIFFYGKVRRPFKLRSNTYIWQSSYIDALDYPHIIQCQVWKLLKKYISYDSSGLYKIYYSEIDSLDALWKAIKVLYNDRNNMEI